MTLNLTTREMESLERLAAKKAMSKTALLKHALRLYKLIDDRVSRGNKLFVEDRNARNKAELMVV